MKILALKNQGASMSIWWVRIFAFLVFLFMVYTIFVTVASKSPINEPIIQSIVVFILGIFLYKLVVTNIVYLTSTGFEVKGVFNTNCYLYEDYIGISSLFSFLEILRIEFSDGKKYHFIARDMRANDFGSLLSEPNDSIAKLNDLIEEYKSQFSE
jgi:hypothetical protein